MRYANALARTVLLSLLMATGIASAQSPSSVLAPTGTLRAVFLGGNPVQGRPDPETGVFRGTVPDLVEELARRLGVPYRLIPAENARAVMDTLGNRAADIGFLAYSETRAREVDYGAAYLVMFSSYLVGRESPIETIADVDRLGVAVGAVDRQSQELFVSSELNDAEIRVFPTVRPQEELETLLTTGELDAFAMNRQRALDAQAASGSRLRALPDSFMEVEQAFVVPMGDAAKLELIGEFVSELRTSGFVQASIDRAGIRGVAVASDPLR